ncbi:MAG TPA: PPC domain-containing protein, partial [Blastocatellia bacterium]|nr:PPC domain-containing protein [Blastocatellia bacterium]
MHKQSFKRAVASTVAALLLTATLVAAQGEEPTLKITRPSSAEKQRNRNTPIAETSRSAAFKRLHTEVAASAQPRISRRGVAREDRISAFARKGQAASAPTLQSFATGGGDINELEPNNSVAQGVSLPVNIFGTVRFDGDVDFFAFQALAGQQVTVEPFAARLSGSRLVADIALFDAGGNLIVSDVGDDDDDPLIRFTPTQDQVLIAGITDADDFGGSRFGYLLNITRGFDADETEPNDRTAQALSELPVTVFGDINGSSDVDFYSFVA